MTTCHSLPCGDIRITTNWIC